MSENDLSDEGQDAIYHMIREKAKKDHAGCHLGSLLFGAELAITECCRRAEILIAEANAETKRIHEFYQGHNFVIERLKKELDRRSLPRLRAREEEGK